MKVVNLCGGKGTRLRERTEYRPQPMVPIGTRPANTEKEPFAEPIEMEGT